MKRYSTFIMALTLSGFALAIDASEQENPEQPADVSEEDSQADNLTDDENLPLYKQIKPYIGLGFGSHEAGSFDDATGYQILLGLNAPFLNLELGQQSIRFAAEVGYQDTGDFETEINGRKYDVGGASGLWLSSVALYDIPGAAGLSAMARFGLDVGDDDGLLYGLGIEYSLGKALPKATGFAVRAEFVKRDNIDSLQLNAAYTF